MKNLEYDEFIAAPAIIQFLYLSSVNGYFVGSDIVERGLKEHPEYFEEEIERRKKFAEIPEEVHTSYWKERGELSREAYKGMPENKGILYYLEHPEEGSEWKKEFDKRYAAERKAAQKIHQKYYGKYGIEWNGF